MFLPTIHSNFNAHAKSLLHDTDIDEHLELKSINSRQILSEVHVTVTFQHHVTYTCKVQKHGTLVFRPTCTCDLLALLSEAMWNLKQFEVRSEAEDTHVQNRTHANATQDSDEINKDT